MARSAICMREGWAWGGGPPRASARPRGVGELVAGGAIGLDVQLHASQRAEGEREEVGPPGQHQGLLDGIAEEQIRRIGGGLCPARGLLEVRPSLDGVAPAVEQDQEPVEPVSGERLHVVAAGPAGQKVRAGGKKEGAERSKLGGHPPVLRAGELADAVVPLQLEGGQARRRGVAEKGGIFVESWRAGDHRYSGL